jgi:hypothetical protein
MSNGLAFAPEKPSRKKNRRSRYGSRGQDYTERAIVPKPVLVTRYTGAQRFTSAETAAVLPALKTQQLRESTCASELADLIRLWTPPRTEDASRLARGETERRKTNTFLSEAALVDRLAAGHRQDSASAYSQALTDSLTSNLAALRALFVQLRTSYSSPVPGCASTPLDRDFLESQLRASSLRDLSRGSFAAHKLVAGTLTNRFAGKTKGIEVEHSPSEARASLPTLLTKLRSGLESANDEAVNAVLAIQSLPLAPERVDEAIQLLVGFIRRHRNSKSQRVLVAVGAAIRKVLLNLPQNQIGFSAELLKVEGSLDVPIEVELEVAKMVVQRVTDDPSINATTFPELANAMFENAWQYSSAKMVNRDFYNAVAINSVVASLLMQHPESNSLVDHLRKDSTSWFRRLCRTRLTRAREALDRRADSLGRQLADKLKSLIEPLGADGGS